MKDYELGGGDTDSKNCLVKCCHSLLYCVVPSLVWLCHFIIDANKANSVSSLKKRALEQQLSELQEGVFVCEHVHKLSEYARRVTDVMLAGLAFGRLKTWLG